MPDVRAPAGSLLTEVEVGGRRLANRLAFAATVTNLGSNTEITARQVAFYAERARGGAGTIVTEGLSVHPTSIPSGSTPLAYERSLVPGFARLADAVHEHGAAIVGQLWHVGRQALWSPGRLPWGPTDRRDPYSGSTPHAMSEPEIAEVIAGYVASAEHLAEAGFDGVELHGAHGYLLTQFLSRRSNARRDRWGGTLENRARIVVEIIDGVRRAVGDDFLVGLKLTAREHEAGGIDLDEARATVAHLLRTGAPDYVAVSQASFGPTLDHHLPDLRFADAPAAGLAAGIRDELRRGVGVMAVGKVPDLGTAQRLIDAGAADLVAMSRPLIADAHLPRKAAAGRPPRPCVYCNVCWDEIHHGRPVACLYAPEAGHERDAGAAPPAGTTPRRIHVVGAGPAGLEFARVAARAGHDVEVHEAAAAAGGRLALLGLVPGLERYRLAAEWLAGEARAAGATLRLGAALDVEAVPSLDGDLVVLAVGAGAVVEPLEGAPGSLSLEAALDDPGQLRDPVWLVDEIEAEPVYAAAEHLAGLGRAVRVLTRQEAIGRRAPYVGRLGALRRLDLAGVELHPLAEPARVEDGELVARHAISGRERPLGPAGTIVRAGPYRSRLAEPPADARVVVIGDALAPREVRAVVYEASATARAVL